MLMPWVIASYSPLPTHESSAPCAGPVGTIASRAADSTMAAHAIVDAGAERDIGPPAATSPRERVPEEAQSCRPCGHPDMARRGHPAWPEGAMPAPGSPWSPRISSRADRLHLRRGSIVWARDPWPNWVWWRNGAGGTVASPLKGESMPEFMDV